MPVRKIKAGYLNTTGGFQSLKLGRFVNAESALEYDFLFLLDLNPSVVWFEEQPLTTGYPDADTGRARSYTPDALARYKKDGGAEHHILYEVKHLADLRKDWKELKPKFKAAIREAKIRGWKFKIVTEKHIRTTRLANLQFLFHFIRSISPLESERRSIIYEGLRELGVSTINELLAFLFHDMTNRAEILPVLYRMIYSGAVIADLDQPLTINTSISLPSI